MDMHAAPISQRHCPAKFRSHKHRVLQKVPGRTVVRRPVEDIAEALLGMIEPAGNQIPHRSLVQIAHQEALSR